MRQFISYSILITLCVATIGTGMVVATVFGTSGLPESDTLPVFTPSQTSTPPLLPTTAVVESPTSEPITTEPSLTPTVIVIQPTALMLTPTVESTSIGEPLPTIGAPTPSQSSNEGADYLEYTVQSGDLLYTIALEYDVSVEDILAINTIANPDSLTIGSVIRIPRR